MANSFHEIVTHLQQVAVRPYLVAIDGRSCAGKSVLAARVQERLPGLVVIHTDDFYRVMPDSERAALNAEEGSYRYSDWQRLEQQVLVPLSAGLLARYQRYDWPRQELAETIDVSPHHIIVVEGVGSMRPELREYYHFRIWIETSESERHQRQLARPWDTQDWIRRWAAAEAYYVENFQPIRSAHAILPGE